MGIFGVFGKKKDKQPPKQALTQEELELQKKRAAQDRQIKEINLAKFALSFIIGSSLTMIFMFLALGT